MEFHVRTGIVTGRNHLLDGRNCQDTLCQLRFELDGQQYLVGVIADGCGEGKHAEVGAQLATQFVPYAIRHLMQLGTTLEELPALLFEEVLHFLTSLIDGYYFADIAERVQFVHEHLLFTLIGFVITPQQTLVLAAGDGLVIINDEIYLREQQNMPTYIGYHLIDQRYLQPNATPLPAAFDLYSAPSSQLKRLAIGSDAWLVEQELLEQIWGMKTPARLQLQMNKWSDTRHFKDDASLIVVERNIEHEGDISP